MVVRLEKNFIKLLDTDIEFRYTVAGYIGLSDITRSLERLHSSLEKLAETQNQTENTLRELAIQVSRLSGTIGFGLEDTAKLSYLAGFKGMRG